MLDRLVSILPASQQTKAKAWIAWLGTVAALLTLVIPTAPSWLTGAVAILTALGVYQVPNRGYVRPTAGQQPALFVAHAPAGKRTPGGLGVWGVILAIAGIVELWGVTNEGSHDTLSEFTRWIFNTDGDGNGPIVFGVGFSGFAIWFLWHILGGRDKRKPATLASSRDRVIPGTLLGGIRDESLNDVEIPADGRVYEVDLATGSVTPVEPLDAPNEDYDSR